MLSKEGMCDCRRVIGNEYFWSNSKCVPTKNETSNCVASYECSSPMKCISNNCLCPGTSYYNVTKHACEEKLLNEGLCDSDRMCNEKKGLYCIANACSCKIGQLWFSGNTSCRSYSNYGEVGCSTDSHCQPGKSLICNLN
jgi:hypothetical protein